ncbi:flavin reductase family protein [Streptomyces sp. NPDC096012]|uniref:flavin reductase family protein n=1 Tax=Streptomyces sp. NPDC096012 TaxID=3155684 RepID=UPI00336AA635
MTAITHGPPAAAAGTADPVPPDVFRETTTRYAGSVTVVACADGDPVGCTATAVPSLTDRPPALLVSPAGNGGTPARVRTAGRFGVSVLPREPRSPADRFARLPAARRFAGVAHDGRCGAPPLAGAVAGAVCEVTRYVPLADHPPAVGRVLHARTDDGGAPLVHFARRRTRPEAASPPGDRRARPSCTGGSPS